MYCCCCCCMNDSRGLSLLQFELSLQNRAAGICSRAGEEVTAICRRAGACSLKAALKQTGRAGRWWRQRLVFRERERDKKKKRAGEITTAEIITASELSGLTSVIARQRSEEADLLRFSPLNEKRFIVVMGAAAFNGRYAAQRLKLTGWEWGGMPNGVVEDRSSPGHNSGLEADDSLHISVHNQPTYCITVRLLSVPEALRFKDTICKNWPLVQLKTNMGLAG